MKKSQLRNIIRKAIKESFRSPMDVGHRAAAGKAQSSTGTQPSIIKPKVVRRNLKTGFAMVQEQPSPSSMTPNQLRTDWGMWLQQNGINFKVLLACNNPLGTPAASQSQNQMLTWTNNIMSLGPFSGTNPNQPCNFINQKITQLQNWISSFSGNPNSIQLALKRCKLEHFQQMYPWAQQLYGC